MHDGFTKLYGSIINSTIWLEPPETKVVWITMLAMANMDGVVKCSVGALARNSGVSVDECKAALNTFLSPDPDSATKAFDGRRIEEVDGGWIILNHAKYREMRSRSQIRNAERQKRFRERQALSVTGVTEPNSEKRPDPDPDPDPDKENNTPLPPKGGSGGKTPPVSTSELIALWNTMAATAGLPTCSGITGKRLTTLKARLKESGWWTNCPPAIAKIPQCPFLTGSNDRAWRATIDWLLRPDSVTRILEGAFDNNKPIDQKRDIALRHEDYHGPFD